MQRRDLPLYRSQAEISPNPQVPEYTSLPTSQTAEVYFLNAYHVPGTVIQKETDYKAPAMSNASYHLLISPHPQ